MDPITETSVGVKVQCHWGLGIEATAGLGGCRTRFRLLG